MFEQRRTVAILPLIASLLGLGFCLWVALSSHLDTNAADCVATGCTLYKDISIAGVSLWHMGAVAFAGLSLCAVRGYVTVGYIAAACMVVGDIILLALMAFTAPCTNCLMVAALFALTFWLFRRDYAFQSTMTVVASSTTNDAPVGRSYVLCVWTLFFFANGLALANENIEPWIIHGPDNAPMRIYFSPSCPSCREAIRTYAVSGTTIAFLPVAEDDDDLYAIATLQKELKNGKNFFPAFRFATNDSNIEKDLPLSEYLTLQWQLLRNKVRFYASGSSTLPLIQMHGMPKRAPQTVQSPQAAIQHGTQQGLEPSGIMMPAASSQSPIETVLPMDSTLHFEGCSEDPKAKPCPTESH